MERPADAHTRERVLRERVRGVYQAFRGYRLAEYIEPDPMWGTDDAPLRAHPLHKLPAEAFDPYARKAMTTWGSLEDFKHFLPRMLEIVALPHRDHAVLEIEAWVVFGKLRYGQWQRWKPSERAAIDGYLQALWLAVLSRPMDAPDTPWCARTHFDWLIAFADALDDLSPLLQRWESDACDPDHGLLAAWQLARAIVQGQDDLIRNGTLGWDSLARASGQEQQVLTWLESDAVARLMEEAFFRWADTPEAGMLSEGQFWLEQFRRRQRAHRQG